MRAASVASFASAVSGRAAAVAAKATTTQVMNPSLRLCVARGAGHLRALGEPEPEPHLSEPPSQRLA